MNIIYSNSFFSQTETCKFKEVKRLPQGHTASMWLSQYTDTYFPTYWPVFFYYQKDLQCSSKVQ